jgi:hypothetical protein
MKLPAAPLLAAGLVLAAAAPAHAGPSLNEVRQQMNSGTWSGITIWEQKPKAPAAAAAPAAPASAAAGGSAQAAAKGTAAPATTAAAAGPTLADRVGDAFLSRFDPPTGRSMAETTRNVGASDGIELPTSWSAGKPKAP